MNSSPRIAPPARASRAVLSDRSRAFLAASALALAGCQPYARRPLDLDATRAAWLTRSPADPSVRAFAAALEPGQPAAGPPGDSAGGFDPEDGLTLGEAEIVALVFNPELRLARLEGDVTRATAAHAGRWDDPDLGIDLERIVSGAGGASPWVASSTIGITIPISGRLEAEKARAGAELAAELDRLAAQEWATRSALRELWVEWSAAQLRLAVTEELLARLRDVATLAERQEQAGAMTRVDARLFRVEIAGNEADAVAASARVKELELQLRAMLGLSPNAALALVPTVAFTPPAADEDELRRRMEASNPELAAARAEYETAERSLRAEVRAQYPDLTIGPGYGTEQEDDRVLFGLSLPIPLWNRNRQGVAEATAQREVARGRFETTYERLSSRLALAIARFEAAQAQRALVESGVVPLADEQEADVRRVASLGRVDALLLLESLKSQHDAKVRLVEARAAESIGAVRLHELIGPAPARPEPANESAPAPSTRSDAGSPAPAEGHHP
ncbi:MAG: TolC family protein [Phycisphaerales bacterium]|nr:TolC family protein [Phycisphaerales bacterium]